MNLPHAAPFECRRHRLEEVLDTAPNPLLERTLKLSHVNVQTDLRAIARVPRLLRGEQSNLRVEAVSRRELLIALTALPEGTQPLRENLVVQMRCSIARLTHKRLRTRERLALGRQGKCDLVLTHLCEVVLEHLIRQQLENVLTAEVHVAAEAKLLDDKFSTAVLRHVFHTKVKVRRAAAKVKDPVGDLLPHTLRLKPVRLEGTDRIGRRLIGTVVHAEAAHHLRIVEERLWQCLPKTALEAHADVLPYALLIAHGEGQDVVEIDVAVHIVDVKAEIVRVNLDRIKPACIQRLRLRIRFDLLNIAASVL